VVADLGDRRRGADERRAGRGSATGRWRLQLTPGRHEVVLEGPLPVRETVQIALPLKPHRIEAKAKGWTVDGLHEDGLADDNLQLTRQSPQDASAAATELEVGTLPPFVRLERALTLGLSWELTTRVVRLTPKGSAVVLGGAAAAGRVGDDGGAAGRGRQGAGQHGAGPGRAGGARCCRSARR
jgi:hypothetical protein